jgi:TrpR-related protein YerC/YecD
MAMTHNSKLKSDNIDELFTAILSLENVDECYRFFEDLATVPEIKSLAQRLQVAKMLLANDTYTAISKTTGASTATISRVKNSLFYGEDGYKLVLERLAEK